MSLAVTGCPPNGGNDTQGVPVENPAVTETPQMETPTVATFYIRTGVSGCMITDADGNASVEAPRGSDVNYVNETSQDVILEFGPLKRLFGVRTAVVYADANQAFTVRDDATVGEHTFSGQCVETQPGPKIIVPPPGSGG
jgi:hypothetical protein